ncbi:hypothetical protein MLD38_024021 [Melastoma candidum]|uniref:Uncharacterized protein n=1 Tax=Melastoma candidum TaxID=119954 RepID=A0ACB9NXQ9_9MYRT|nr:hypothetical protein MLD38_024021 [Melastoma candidum]
MRKPCCEKKGAWTKQEDEKLVDYVREHGEGCWRSLPQAAGLPRCGRSCRLRWEKYLRPNLKWGNFGEDEEDLIIKLHALLGNRWSLIAGRLPGRTDMEIKNYWNMHLQRKLIQRGTDQNNHRPGLMACPSISQHLKSNTAELKFPSHEEDEGAGLVLRCPSEPERRMTALPDLNLDLAMGLPFPEENSFPTKLPQLGY